MKVHKSDIITEFNGIYSGVPTAEFIAKRDKHVANTRDNSELNKYRRLDSEFPENDIINHRGDLTLYEGIEYDNIHEKYGNIDFKIFAKIGVKINYFPQEQVLLGNIDHFLIWKWVEPWSNPLREGEEYSYEILGMVDAHKAINALRVGKSFPGKDPDYRFNFPLN